MFQKATRSYQKDIATAQLVAKANGAPEDGTSGKYLSTSNMVSLASLLDIAVNSGFLSLESVVID